MSEQLIDLLKLGLLALLYLFFLRVIWAVWTELRTPEPGDRVPRRARRAKAAAAPATAGGSPRGTGAATAPRRRAALRALRVIEPRELAGTEYPLAREMTLGRAPGCTVVVDDTYVSQLHARVFAVQDGYSVEDLGSTNGTLHNGSQVSAPAPLRPGDRLQVGNVVLEAVR